MSPAAYLRMLPPRVISRPVIGSRAPAGPVMRFDTATGAFESINSQLLDADERAIQRLLLTPTKQELKARKKCIESASKP